MNKTEFQNAIVGLNITQANALQPGFVCRPIMVDNVFMETTKDFNDNRLNVEIKNGIITKYYVYPNGMVMWG